MQGQPTCCACGCGEPLNTGGRYRLGHSANRPIAPRYIVDDNGCWVWQRTLNRDGYAMIWVGGHNRPAHRIYFHERYGHCPATLDHTCRNRACVNPEHLEVCGRGENVRRGDVAVLDWAMVAEIRLRALFFEGYSQRAVASLLAPDYPVHARAIRQVLRGERWPESARPAEV
jgi:hypothetical protein